MNKRLPWALASSNRYNIWSCTASRIGFPGSGGTGKDPAGETLGEEDGDAPLVGGGDVGMPVTGGTGGAGMTEGLASFAFTVPIPAAGIGSGNCPLPAIT